MDGKEFAVVKYLRGNLANFVDSLRHRFDPALAEWLAHVTILPPRPLEGPWDEPLEAIRKACALFEPFEISLGDAATFWPTSGVVYLPVASGADRLKELHDALNAGPLKYLEPHAYVPHITIAQELDESGKNTVLRQVREEWLRYGASASFEVDSLLLVRKTAGNRWRDLASIPLGSQVERSHALEI